MRVADGREAIDVVPVIVTPVEVQVPLRVVPVEIGDMLLAVDRGYRANVRDTFRATTL